MLSCLIVQMLKLVKPVSIGTALVNVIEVAKVGLARRVVRI